MQLQGQLIPALWPSVWHHNIWSDMQGQQSNRCGARTSYTKGAKLIYSCPCGSTFERALQEKIEEAREWVKEHTAHLPPEEQHE